MSSLPEPMPAPWRRASRGAGPIPARDRRQRFGNKGLALSASLLWMMLPALIPATALAQTDPFPGIGRVATAREITAWDIDVRPDFKGLPKGAGTVDQGLEIWEATCASCHGVFGESNQFISPIIRGTTKGDIATGKVARLTNSAYPSRATLMKLSQVSTLWDYIRRAMPWNAPKSLSVDEVYAVTAYLLNMGGIVPDDFKLTDQNMAEVQQRLPNRNGVTTEHGMWPGAAFGNQKPDMQAVACMKDCFPEEPKVVSALPDFARNAHGNLAEQNRLVGAQLGADTSKPAPATLAASAALRGTDDIDAAAVLAAASAASSATSPAPSPDAAAKPAADAGNVAAAWALADKNGCVACHGLDTKVIGPSFRDIAKKYAGRTDAADYLAGKIKSGGVGVWGPVPMPAQTLDDANTRSIAQWLADGAKK